MNVFRYEKDDDGIVTVTMDMTGPVNAMNQEYRKAMAETLARLETESDLAGVVITSAKSVFFAGGDLKELLTHTEENRHRFIEQVERDIKGSLRRLEKLPVPVVAAINGAALGGGFEICLASNYRIALDERRLLLGVPEVGLGLLPGAGGIVRLVNLLGLERALPYLLEGRKIPPQKALAEGLIDAVVFSRDELLSSAKTFILANRDAALQPWDRENFTIPGGKPDTPHLAGLIEETERVLEHQFRGLLPAPLKILECAVAAAQLDFDEAMRVETQAIAELVIGPVAKNMITTFFFHMNRVNSGASRPAAIEKTSVKKLGVLGAGLMGQGIAYVSALAGIPVVLKEVSLAAAEKGKAYTDRLLQQRVAKGKMDAAKKTEVLGLIKPTAEDAELEGCDLIIEAVFEDLAVKYAALKAAQHYLADNGVWGSNTSSLPIRLLAEDSVRPENFIGIHFFSPVDKMPLVEIVCGEATSDETLAKAFDYARQIGKTPIVIDDSPGGFTTRTILSYLDEGCRLLVEGIHPKRIDDLGKAVGMPLGPLQIHDETGLDLTYRLQSTWAELGLKDQWGEQDTMRTLITTLVVENGRGGRHRGGGFYDYGEQGKVIWPPLLERYHRSEVEQPDQDIKDRLLLRQVIEALKCLEGGVLRSVADGNVGSVLGIGAPTWTGGFIQFVNTYGLQRFIERCDQLAKTYGERFRAPSIVAEKIAAGELFG